MTTRQPEMTSAERLRAAFAGKPVDHVPFAPFLAYFWEAQPEAVQNAGQLAFLRSIGADPLWRCSPGVATSRTPGLEMRVVQKGTETEMSYETPVGSITERYRQSDNGNTRYLIKHAVGTREDFEVLAWIEEHTEIYADGKAMAEHFAANGSEGLSLGNPLHVRGPGLIKSAYQQLVEHWVGTEQLTFVTFDNPEYIDAVLAPMTERNREAVALSVSLDEYDYFLTFEDSSTQNYSPAIYDQYIAPEITSWQQMLSGSGKQYVQHACGHLKALLPSLKRQGIWGAESLTPPDTGNVSIAEARAIAGPEFGIVGGIEPVKLESMSANEAPGYVKSVLEQNGGGRLVLSNADSCPPGTSVEVLRAIASEVSVIR